MPARKLIVALNISVDGFADHTVGVAADDELHDFFSGLLDLTGVELFGRVTYQMMESYWPHVHQDPKASASDLRFADKFNNVPKAVFSKTLEKAEWSNTTLVKSDAFEYVERLKEQAGKDLYVGGIQFARSLMKQGLVDECWLLVHPVIAGNGKRLFENEGEHKMLKLIESKSLRSGVVALHYSFQK